MASVVDDLAEGDEALLPEVVAVVALGLGLHELDAGIALVRGGERLLAAVLVGDAGDGGSGAGIVEDGEDLAHQVRGGELQVVGTVALEAAPGIVELGVRAEQAVVALGFLGEQPVPLGGQRLQPAFHGFGRQLRGHAWMIRVGVLGSHYL